MANQHPTGESDGSKVSESEDAGDFVSEGSIGASVRINRRSFEADFNANLKTDDKDLSLRFWSTIIRHLRCWLALAVIALFALGILAGAIGSQLRELLDALLR